VTHDEARTILGVSAFDPPEAVASAYKKLVFDVHPDRNPNDKSAGAKAARFTEAYAVLRGTQRPSGQYGTWRPSGTAGRSAADVMDDLLRDVGETLKENKTGFAALATALGVMGLAELFKRAKRSV
jgi:DnaJ-class molecular chaperone